MKNLLFKITILPIILFFSVSYTIRKSDVIKKIDYYASAANKDQLLAIVRNELAAKRKPVLFFTATWCGPCKQFKNSLSDALMQDALKDVTLIMIDADIDGEEEQIGSVKYTIKAFPTFLRVDANGKVIKRTDGSAWDENTPKIWRLYLKNL